MRSTSPEDAFAATLAGIGLPDGSGLDLGATLTATDPPASFGSFRAPGPLPAMAVRYPTDTESDGELDLVHVLGEGGMGRVYLARQRSLEREVAVKTVKVAGVADAAAAICDEAVITGRLSHPNVIPVHALARDGEGRPLLVMKRVDGVAWDEILASPEHPFWARKAVPEDERLLFHVEVLRQVAHAVSFAHSRGVVHRDIKPENVMIGDFGEVYLVDWGLAVRVGHTTDGRALVGTPSYLAPEMIGAGVIDERTDVYLLGATLHDILTGRAPHEGASLQAVLFSAFTSESPTYGADVPGELGDLARRSLARVASERPASAQAFGEALEQWVRHRGSLALSRTGADRLAVLEEAVATTASADRDLRRVRNLVAECRFALTQARRAWADNPDVAPALAECMRLAFLVELERRDLETARSAFADLVEHATPDPSLEERLRALEADVAREAAEREAHQKLVHDLDPQAHAQRRLTAILVTLVSFVAVSVYALVRYGPAGPKNMAGLLELSVLACLGPAVALALVWRAALATTFNRRLVGWACFTCGVPIAQRFSALWFGVTDLTSVFVENLIGLAACFAIGALFLFPWMLWMALVLLCSAAAAAWLPTHALLIFAIVVPLSVAGFAVPQLRRPSA